MHIKVKIIITILFTFSFFQSHAQWFKRSSSESLYYEARKETDKKNYKHAIVLCNEALTISPKNLDIHLLLGRLYYLTNNIDSARSELNFIINKNHKYKDAYLYLINMEIALCNYQAALLYCDKAMTYYPNDKELLMKKMEILNKAGYGLEASKLGEYIITQYPTDDYVMRIYIDQMLTAGRDYARHGFLSRASESYQAVLQQDPGNKEALEALYNIDVRSGNYEASLAYTNRALQNNPNSYEFLLKKVGILEEMHRYAEAIEVLQKMIKLNPSDEHLQRLMIDLRMTAGRFYMATDPSLQFQAVLERDPANREALDHLINLAYSRGMYQSALEWVNKALKYYGNDPTLIGKKIGILEILKNYTQAAPLQERMYAINPTQANRDYLFELTVLSGRQYMLDQQYDSAIIMFNKVLQIDPSNISALNYSISVYITQKRYDEALRVLDYSLTYYPDDETLLFRKAGVLESYQKYAEAAQITRQLVLKDPENKKYLTAYIDESLAAGRDMLQFEDYSNALALLHNVLDQQPNNIDALNYMINAQSAIHNYDSAAYYCDVALQSYPGNKDFLLKKASVLFEGKRYSESYAITDSLYQAYPYNLKVKRAYMDALLASGRVYSRAGNYDSAMILYDRALTIDQYDTTALYYTINELNEHRKYKDALVLIDRGRRYYPNNGYFLLKRAVVLDNYKRYNEAYLAADSFSKLNPFDLKNAEYARYLYSRTLKNEIGFFFLHTIYDPPLGSNGSNNIATVQYLRYTKRGSIEGRVNYAARAQGTGLQYDLETYYNHTPTTFSYAVASFSNKVIFPKLRLGYSLFHDFPKGWEGEIGIRYLDADSFTATSFVFSVGRYYKEFYFNVRDYIIQLDGNQYNSIAFTSRYYINDNKTDYFSFLAGYGTAPDDRSTNYILKSLAQYQVVIVGVGFRKAIRYLTVVGVDVNWLNQRINSVFYRNQYDIYLTLTRRF
ncbi:MAG: tetratricopeptide repeat protein [Taibaiella sp.]|nr:tetratricopeptide repeat protein [Taibaiella sp.]